MNEPLPEIAIIDDEKVIRDSLGDFLVRRGHRVRGFPGGSVALAEFARNPPDFVILDVRMPGEDGLEVLGQLAAQNPGLPVIMLSGHGNMDTAIAAMRLGAADFLRKPVRFPDLLAALERTMRLQRAERDRDRLRATLARVQASAEGPGDAGFIAGSPACHELRELLTVAERSQVDGVLIVGETGTGKDVLARELHRRLHGVDAPFVAVNCPALPEHLVESELFGHMRGAFTGADGDRPGAFELADGGTLFLDELGDLARAAQAKLLRALETREVRRLGGRREVAVAVTVIAATNQDLGALVEQGAFRRDLLYRLNVFQITIPPLRDRREDIRPLADRFLAQAVQRRHLAAAGFTPAALAALEAYDFPGNARELRNLVERAALLCRDGRIDESCLALPRAARPAFAPAPAGVAGVPVGPGEAAATLAALTRQRWNRRAAAAELGISYEALRWRIEKHRLGG